MKNGRWCVVLGDGCINFNEVHRGERKEGREDNMKV